MPNIKKFLRENADLGYADFNRKFVSSRFPILGVRIPLLKKYAKNIEPEQIELENPHLSHEEILLYGFSAAQFENEGEQIEYLQNILPYIDNWMTCDSIVCALKSLNGEKSYQYLIALLKSEKEFYVRVGIVGLMRNFLRTQKLPSLLVQIRKIKDDAFYVKMATAWLYAELATINFEIAEKEIKNCKDAFIKSKAISKARESFRLSPDQKQELQNLKK